MFDKLPARIRILIFRLAAIVPVLIRRRKLLLVRLDAIGDYVLFRNELEFLQQSNRFRGYPITLLGNTAWKDLPEKYDKPFVSRFIFIRPDILYNRERYTFSRLLLMLQLKFKGFSVVIHPVHSRLSDIDHFISDLNIPERIASMGDAINCPPEIKATTDALYTQLVPVPGPGTFEFIRNREFIRRVTGDETRDLPLSLPKKPGNVTEDIIAIVPGAGHAFRQWSYAHFAELIQKLSRLSPATEFYLLGSGSDTPIAKQIAERSENSRIRDITGKTTLPEFVETIQRSLLVVGNDSSAIHIAAASGVPAVCISNGNMFGRFHPYPGELKKDVITVYGDSSFYDPGKFHYLAKKTEVRSEFSINDVTPEAVMTACLRVMESAGKAFG